MLYHSFKRIDNDISLYFFLMGSNFKQNLREELDFQGIIVKELSAKTNIPVATLDCYLRTLATEPSAENAVKIAQALGVSVEYLILGEKNKQENPSLSSEIRVLVQNYKQLSENDRKMIIAITQLYKNQK